MLVRDIMTTKVVTVGLDTPVEEVARLIAEKKISGVFVTKGGHPVGQISHADLLRHTHPTPAELYEDYVHNGDYEEIEHRIADLVGMPTEQVMRPGAMMISPDTPVMKVSAMMLVRDVHRAAVVDDTGLCGVVSRGDVFYHLIRAEVLKKRRAGTRGKTAA
ncbi:MAG TPA: CBS domain-containing protein [Patescibacteria group bacterium]|jgi:CBS domain-containing protein